MTRLHHVLTVTDLPLAELHAARLDGELYALDGCFCPIDEPELQVLRAESIVAQWPYRLIAEQRSAAWVLGVIDTPPRRHELCADIGARARPTNLRRASVREVVIDASEILRIGTLDVTTPLRTAVDLARFSVDFGSSEREMCAGLMRLGSFGVTDCEESMNSRKNLPNKKLALERLASVG
jgi:hypothetical protein